MNAEAKTETSGAAGTPTVEVVQGAAPARQCPQTGDQCGHGCLLLQGTGRAYCVEWVKVQRTVEEK